MSHISHIAIYVTDLEQSKQFFEKYFNGIAGDIYINRQTKFRSYFITFGGNCTIELMHRPEVTANDSNRYRCGYAHIAMSVGSVEDVDALTERLVFDGYETVSGPRMTGDGYYESCVKIFDDILIEITV